MILVRSVSVRAGRALLLDDVSLTLAAGQLTAVLGRNGAGKTTLLRLLAGALPPDAGAVTLDGASMAGFTAIGLARRRAVLSQHAAAAPGLTVAETVALGRLMFRGTPAQADELAAREDARARFGLAALWPRRLASLSGGERQRVHIARAAAQLWRRGGRADGLALFLDEPAASLDLGQQAQAMAFARECAARGAAVLAVLHDPNHALGADQVVLMAGGRLLAVGPPEAVLTPAALTACLGAPLQRARKDDGEFAFVL